MPIDIKGKFIDQEMATDAELSTGLSSKVDKISGMSLGTYKRPVFTVNEQGQITEIREKILLYVDNNSTDTVNNANPISYLSTNFTCPEVSNYYIEFACLFRVNSTSNSPVISILLNGTSIYDPSFVSWEEAKDTATNERILRSGFIVKEVQAGINNVDMQFRLEASGGTMTMYFGAIRISEE